MEREAKGAAPHENSFTTDLISTGQTSLRSRSVSFSLNAPIASAWNSWPIVEHRFEHHFHSSLAGSVYK
jgi:hypothetical protein